MAKKFGYEVIITVDADSFEEAQSILVDMPLPDAVDKFVVRDEFEVTPEIDHALDIGV